MANVLQQIGDVFKGIQAMTTIAKYLNDPLDVRYGILADYYVGDHRRQLKVKTGGQDDNITQNYIGLGINRSVSRLLRGGVDFVLQDGVTNQQEYIDKVWELNKKNILLYQLGYHGAVFGVVYLQIVVDAIQDPITAAEDVYPRLVALYPRIVRVRTSPQDLERVEEYIVEYSIKDDVREVAYRENTVRDGDQWRVENWIKEGSAQWRLVSSVVWAYDFPPIIHWKNLPSLNSVYGTDEISDAVNIQDKNNFVVSNSAKIIKHHAVPPVIFTGVSASQIEKLDSSPDNNVYAIPSAEADAKAIENNADLANSRAMALDLRQSIFDIMREVDISSMSDKLGALTNFGLRVLYTDASDKNDTKRQLYGEALREINRRLLVLAGYKAEGSDPGGVQWGDIMIVNPMEEAQTDKMLFDMHLVDEMTLAQKWADRWGVEWDELEKLLQEAKDEREEKAREQFERGGFGGGGMEAGGKQRPVDGQD